MKKARSIVYVNMAPADKRPLPRVVAVDWMDSAGLSGWADQHSTDSLAADLISSVGFLVRETKAEITISAHRPHSATSSAAHAPMSIPKCSIVRRRWIK